MILKFEFLKRFEFGIKDECGVFTKWGYAKKGRIRMWVFGGYQVGIRWVFGDWYLDTLFKLILRKNI